VLQYSTSGRPDLGVYASRFEGRNMGSGSPGLLSGRLSATETYERAYKGHMVKVRVLGAAQRLTSYYNIQQNTARIARTDRKAFYQGEYTVSV
jgi:hypothetical protein